MKQKIVIKVCMCCDKSRLKAMALAAATDGVHSVALDGKYRDELVIGGDDVDTAKLTCALRRKVAHADLVHVSEVVVKPKEDDKKKPPLANPSPPPQPVTIICHHCGCHPVGYAYYSYCCCYCHRH